MPEHNSAPPRGRPLALLLPLVAGLAGNAWTAEPPREVSRGCPPERAQDGEARLVFLGDSGFGRGFSEWGAHGQEAVADRIEALKLAPDLVFFLGDNIYWLGSASLYKSNFDDVYDPLIRECKAHVALGNHDVKGCRAVQQLKSWESCLQELKAALVSDRKARYLRQGIEEAQAAEKAEADTAAETAGELAAEAVAARRANCLPGDSTAYENAESGTCHAGAALEHAQFGFGAVDKGDPPASLRQRYYSILWPLPKSKSGETGAETVSSSQTRPPRPGSAASNGGETGAETFTTRPLVDVIVLDSNTLRVSGGKLQDPDKRHRREDSLQLLWMRNALAQWLPAPGEKHGIWKILAMHHPPYTPRSCACRLFGKCLGGHGDQPGLREQLVGALEDLEPPDLVMTGHNHIYARSHPLDASGTPVTSGTGGVRYFVTGGGGAPLYDVHGEDSRFAKALTRYHFVLLRLKASSAFYWAIDTAGRVLDAGCWDKGSNVDRPLSPDFGYADSLPDRCGEPAP
jgi:hypothetical protein